MISRKTAPSLRFRGFSEPWEEKKLGEIINICSGRDYKHLSEGNIPVYGTGGYMLSVNEALSYDQDAIGIGRKGTIDKPYILKAPFWTVDTLFYALPKENIDLNFVFDIFQNIEWKKRDESTGVPRLSKTAINDINVYISRYTEQKQIGQFFSNLDHLIALEQQKYDKLNTVKKSMLEKMFPQKGAKVPEIRFKGFSEPWEEKKLGEIAPLRGGFAFKSSQYDNNGIPIIRISNILSDGCIGNEFIYYHEQQNDEVYSLSDAAVLIAMSGATTGKVAILHEKKSSKYYQNQRVGYFVPTLECDYGFIAIIVRSHFFSKQLSAVLVAGAQPNVSSKDIDSFEFLIPVSKEEQQAIGSYFKDLDRLITLQNRKIEKLRNLKKACLKKMFV